MSDVMVAALSDRLEVYEHSQDRTLIDTPEALVESLGVMRTVAAQLGQGSLDVGALLNVCWLHYYRGTRGRHINLSSSDLPVAGLLSVFLDEHRPGHAADLPPVGAGHVTTEGWCALVSVNARHLAQDPTFSAVVHEVLMLIGRSTGDRAVRRRVQATAGHLLYDRYKFSDDISYLANAVQCLRDAADPVVEDDADPGPDPTVIDGLGTTTYFLYNATDDVDLLVESVNSHARALTAGPGNGPRRLGFMDNLGASLHALALVRRDPALLWQAVDCFMEVAGLHSTDSDRWQAIDKVWRTLEITCRVCRTPADLETAIEMGNALLEQHGDRDPEHGHHLSIQSALLHARVTLKAVPELLDLYVRIARRAAEAFPVGDPVRARMRGDLGVALATRFTYRRDPEDRAEALELLRAAATDLPDEPVAQDNLQKLEADVIRRTASHAQVRSLDQIDMAAKAAVDLGDAYVLFSNPMFLSEAIRLAEAAVKAIGPEHSLYCELNRILAQLWEHEAQRSGVAADLDRAIAYAESGATESQAGTPGRAELDSRLAQLLRLRFEQRGDLADLQEAVRRGNAAVRDARDSRERAIALNRLGLSLGRRYEHNRDLVDMRECIDAYLEAVDLSVDNPQLRASVLNNLGGAYSHRFQRHQIRADLERAVECWRECARLTHPEHANAATRWDNFARALHHMYGLDRDPAHLTEALAYADRAVAATPLHHIERGRRLTTLSNVLVARYHVAGDPADLSRAVTQARAAVRTPSADQAHRAEYLNNLGSVLVTAGALRSSEVSVDEVLAVFDEARRHQPSLVHLRGIAARKWAAVRAAAGDAHAAIDGAEFAFDLLQQIDWHGMALADRLDVIREWDGFAREVAVWALRSDDPARAVEFLERGRGLLWGQLTGHVGDLERLRAVDTRLAEEFLAIRDEARELTDSAVPDRARGERLADVNAEHRRIVSRIRALDGFDAFLGPPSPGRLAAAMGDGAVVILNVSRANCDAIVLRGPGIRAVPLAVPGMEVAEQVRRWTTVLRTAQEARRELNHAALKGRQAPRWAVVTYRTAIDELGELLAWGWDALTGPVLTALGHKDRFSGNADWPRVWWCPTGPLTAFPLAATGHHDGSGRAVIDRVVSSEAPTLRSLAEAQERGTAQNTPRLLAVAVPTPYDRGDVLHGAQEERAAVLASTSIEVTDLYGPTATRETLLRELPAHSRFHFAGHGAGGVTDPTDAALIAFDAPLRMTDLVGLPLDGAELAYLSTCHGVTGSATHPDESLHLAAAIHVVGFRHVIAARQEIDDRVAADTAAAFHRHLAHTPDPGIALHETLRDMREQLTTRTDADCDNPVNPWAWAGFVHLGPAGARLTREGAGAEGH
ncbi:MULTISPECIES: CHAT domain-containing protein [Streptomyces]|uniref:CHAT domain-containing protein n=1 Tax=Streptomyces canarius TaxID=285453 RepID=A0ABQ3CHA7_9ACTN|nr:CHAT domain-containing protein [Streptomyces canarius]GHA15200.1 CHAT domain-containing protein [Streptomyces canarius]